VRRRRDRMAEGKKYYWLKLKRDFFKRHDIRIVESMPNGKDYILFYLKLLLESIDHEGTLRFSETIPYNEQMLSVVTDTNIDIVRSAMKIFVELNMMSICDDQTIFMTEVDKLIGSETEWAKKKREQRLKKDNVPALSSNCPTEIEKEKELHKELHIDVDAELEEEVKERETSPATTATEENKLIRLGGTLGKNVLYLTEKQDIDLLERLGFDAYNRYLDRLSTFIIEKGAHVKNHYETILKWYEEDTKMTGGKT
jgi:predicted phage replisome organizer